MTGLSLKEQLERCTDRCKEMDAPLVDRLKAMADDVRRLAPEFTVVVDKMVEHLRINGAGEAAPLIGEPMPDFVLPDDNGHLVSLGQLLKSGQVVIAFHRGHWCPYCRINADALAAIETEVKTAGGQLVVIMPETQKFTRKLKADAGATYPILTDMDNGYALEVHLAIMINDVKRKAMTLAGWDIAPYQGNANWILPIPGTFVVGQNGLVKGRFVDPDYRKRMDIEDLLAALR